jgi:hypothetical protein
MNRLASFRHYLRWHLCNILNHLALITILIRTRLICPRMLARLVLILIRTLALIHRRLALVRTNHPFHILSTRINRLQKGYHLFNT